MEKRDDIRSLEPWPGYFKLRSAEMGVFFRLWEPPRVERILEIGCGIGYVSSFFAGFAESVFATDLVRSDGRTNTGGAEKTRRFLNSLEGKKVFFFGGDAATLPVRSKSMDIVFSMSVLEHVAPERRDAAVREMKRVLKENGSVIAILPTFAERAGSYAHYYADLLVRFVKRYVPGPGQKKEDTRRTPDSSVKRRSTLEKLLPPMHGAYANHVQELCSQFPPQWERLFRRNGLEVTHTFTTRFLPFTTKSFIWLYSVTNGAEARLGNKAPFKYLGKNYCIVAKAKERK